MGPTKQPGTYGPTRAQRLPRIGMLLVVHLVPLTVTPHAPSLFQMPPAFMLVPDTVGELVWWVALAVQLVFLARPSGRGADVFVYQPGSGARTEALRLLAAAAWVAGTIALGLHWKLYYWTSDFSLWVGPQAESLVLLVSALLVTVRGTVVIHGPRRRVYRFGLLPGRRDFGEVAGIARIRDGLLVERSRLIVRFVFDEHWEATEMGPAACEREAERIASATGLPNEVGDEDPKAADGERDALEGTLLVDAELVFPARPDEDEDAPGPEVRFVLRTDDGTEVRVHGRPHLMGPGSDERIVLRPGDRAWVEGAIETAMASDGYRGPARAVPVAIEVIAIGIGPDGEDWVTEERARRVRRKAVEEATKEMVSDVREALRDLARSARGHWRGSAGFRAFTTLALLFAITGLSLELARLPVPTTRYLLVAWAGLFGYAAIFALVAKHVPPDVKVHEGATLVLIVGGMWVLYHSINVFGGAVDWAQRGMLGVVGAGPLTYALIRFSQRHPKARGLPVHRTLRPFRRAILLPLLYALLFSWHNVAQNHVSWTAEVVDAERHTSLIGKRCTVELAWSPPGSHTDTPQCEVDVVCGGTELYGAGVNMGFIRCEVRGDGFFGTDDDASDGDGTLDLRGYGGDASGVRFERVD